METCRRPLPAHCLSNKVFQSPSLSPQGLGAVSLPGPVARGSCATAVSPRGCAGTWVWLWINAAGVTHTLSNTRPLGLTSACPCISERGRAPPSWGSGPVGTAGSVGPVSGPDLFTCVSVQSRVLELERTLACRLTFDLGHP